MHAAGPIRHTLAAGSGTADEHPTSGAVSAEVPASAAGPVVHRPGPAVLAGSSVACLPSVHQELLVDEPVLVDVHSHPTSTGVLGVLGLERVVGAVAVRVEPPLVDVAVLVLVELVALEPLVQVVVVADHLGASAVVEVAFDPLPHPVALLVDVGRFRPPVTGLVRRERAGLAHVGDTVGVQVVDHDAVDDEWCFDRRSLLRRHRDRC